MKNDAHESHKWSDEHTNRLDTNDWEVAVVRSLGGGKYVGAGYVNFAVRSMTLEIYARLVFVGAGANIGVWGGINFPSSVQHVDCSTVNWVSLRKSIAEPFSMSNWINSEGELAIFAIGSPGNAGWGYSKMAISAKFNGSQRSGHLFQRHSFSGWGFGTGGLGMGMNQGYWRLLDVPKPHQLDADWTKPVCEE